MAEQDVENFACEADEETAAVTETSTAPAKKEVKGPYVSNHSSGFRDVLLKPELLRAIVYRGFEHPSEVQHEYIQKATLGMDIMCQAKSGKARTAVFVLPTLQQIEPVDGQVIVLVLCHSRDLACQISKEYERFSKYMNTVKVAVFVGGMTIKKDRDILKRNCPHIVVGTPGRILQLVKEQYLNLKNVKHVVLDDCEMILEWLAIRRDVQEIFRHTPHEKQCMMFSATLSKEIQPVCRKFMQEVHAVYMAEQDVEIFTSEADEEPAAVSETSTAPSKEVKGSHVSTHSSGFRDFLLKPELLRAIVNCSFKHPSEVQHECIQKALLGMDVMCQTKSSGMGKTAVFVLATLQQIKPVDGRVIVLVMCHNRELAFQILKEYKLFSKYMNTVKVAVFVGPLSRKKDKEVLKKPCPHIVVGTPGRILPLARNKHLNLKHVKHFVLCDCEWILKFPDIKRDVVEIFRNTPHEKQCLMFSATLSKEIRPVCRKFMREVHAVFEES